MSAAIELHFRIILLHLDYNAISQRTVAYVCKGWMWLLHSGAISYAPAIHQYPEYTLSAVRLCAPRLNWLQISVTLRLQESFMDEFAARLEWVSISAFQNLSEAFIERHRERVCWRQIILHQSITAAFLTRYFRRLY